MDKKAAYAVPLVVVLVLLLSSVGCAPAAAKEITIGIVGDQSGVSAPYGLDTRQGAQTAVDEINAAGGIGGATLVLRVYDEKGDPVEAVKIAPQVADETVATIVCSSSSPALAIGPKLEELGIPFIVTVSSNLKITSSGWKWASRIQPADPDQINRMVAYISKNLKYKKIALLHDTTDLGTGARDALVNTLKQ